MRGYTSLISHILGSHPEIKGYSEMHQSYRTFVGLFKLRVKAKLTTNSLTVPTFLYDKLLHNKYVLDKQIIKRQNVYTIIMVRKPEATIKSIINMGQTLSNVAWYKDEKKVTAYYIKRLEKLVKIAEKASGKAIFLQGEDLIHHTDKTLSFLTNELKLNSPLEKEYNTFSLTGTQGLGDPSDNIKAGKILKKRDSYSGIQIGTKNLKLASDAYHDAIERLNQLCKTN